MKKLIVSVTDFGVTNTESLQTEKIQSAIDYCFQQGGGEVTIPAGVYHTGGLRLRSNVCLHLLENAILRGSKNPEEYFAYRQDQVEPLGKEDITDVPYTHLSTILGETQYDAHTKIYDFKRVAGSRWNNALIRAIDAKNISIIGEKGSVLDGNDCFDAEGEEGYRGPHCLTLFRCENVHLKGYTIQNSANWAHNILFSQNISVTKIKVLAGHDGFDAAVCSNIIIEDSEFYTGDDCIAGFGNLNVLVKNCILNSACSALRFGGTNVLIEGCHIYGPCKYLFRGSLSEEEKRNGIKPAVSGHRCNMLSAFTYYADFSLPIEQEVENIIISNCKIENADRLLHYNFSGNETWQRYRPLRSIQFKNTIVSGLKMPLTAYGAEEEPFSADFSQMEISFAEGYEKVCFMHLCHYDKIRFRNVTVKNNKSQPFIKIWSPGSLELDGLNAGSGFNIEVLSTQEQFQCKDI